MTGLKTSVTVGPALKDVKAGYSELLDMTWVWVKIKPAGDRGV